MTIFSPNQAPNGHTPMKTIMLWLSFLIAIICGIIGGGAPIAKLMDNLDWIHSTGLRNLTTIALLASMLPSLAFGIYVSDVVWLMAWRRFASREEVARIVFAGPTSRFDRWLFDCFFPPLSTRTKKDSRPATQMGTLPTQTSKP